MSILLVGDSRMLKLNLLYRGKRKTTDVLSFPLNEGGAVQASHIPLGDVVINIHAAKRQARQYGSTFYDEFYRLMAHGILHLLGHDHEASAYKARKMFKKQQELIDALKKTYRKH